MTARRLPPAHSEALGTSGWTLLEGVFPAADLEPLMAEIGGAAPAAEATRTEGDGTTRIVYGTHLGASSPFAALAEDPRLTGLASEVLGEDVYVHQTKITNNARFTGTGWPWHQDFTFWGRRDAIPTPRLLNVVVLLDDVTHLNGPICFFEGSHERGSLPFDDDGVTTPAALEDLAATCPAGFGVGPRGSVLLFGAEVVHGSAPNIGPCERRLAFVTFNALSNGPRGAPASPSYLAGTAPPA